MEPKRFLFVMGDGGGNVPPQLGLARRLVSRGHEVRVLTEPCVADDVRAAGASYVSLTKAPHRSHRSPASDFVRDFDAKTPIGALAAFRDRVIFGPAHAFAQDTMAEIERWRPHVLAPDWLRTGAAVAGEAAGVPTALLVHGNNLLPERGKPPPGFGFLPAKSARIRARHRVFERVFLRLFNKGLPALNDARRAYGLEPLGHVLEHFSRPARFLCLYSEAFDLPADRHPANHRYVGAVLEEPAWTEPWNSPWSSDDRRPLVVISLSTSFMKQERALRRCIDAVSSMPVRALVTVGPALHPEAFSAPENVMVVQSAPHDEVFPQADAVVTHAGMGTVVRGLANGLPLVCMPMGRDQADIAARVRWHGAGVIAGRNPSAARIQASLERVLHEPGFREGAARLQKAIQQDSVADRGVAELEALTVRPFE
ncbi:MAG: glycosyltransferase [Actinobacteria bacterium]|nr:glycosyltransferase [Actinomycetota bacterium]